MMSESPSHQKYKKDDINNWDKEEIVEKMIVLEEELIEFQVSSKELERALEEELQQLESGNNQLVTSNKLKDKSIGELNSEVLELKSEIRRLNDENSSQKMKYEQEIRQLKQTVVDIEIKNDSMELNDRVANSKLGSLNQFNNELLEKIAILENENYLQKKANDEKDLHISNYINTINDLKAQGDRLHQKSTPDTLNDEVDILYLSMKDVLRAGPPESPYLQETMKKSDSLQRLHELLMRSENLSNKMRTLKRNSLYLSSPQLKSPSTTQLSNHLHTSKSRSKAKEELPLEKSTTSKNLTNMLYQESRKDDQESESKRNGNKELLPSNNKPNNKPNTKPNTKPNNTKPNNTKEIPTNHRPKPNSTPHNQNQSYSSSKLPLQTITGSPNTLTAKSSQILNRDGKKNGSEKPKKLNFLGNLKSLTMGN